MELTNEFRVSVPPADAWKVLTDAERIAPMLPGAQLQEIEGDELRGIIKVKVGPITAQYKGTASWVERDESAGRAVLKASGRDTRGQGNASATITCTMSPDGEGTRVEVVTDLTITGKVAQFGRGVLADVSGKLIGQFVDALEADLKGGRSEPAAEHGAAEAESVAAGSGSAGAEAAAGTSGPTGESSGSAAPPGGSAEEQSTPASTETPGAGSATSPSSGPREATSSGSEAAGTPTSSGARRVDHPEPEPVDLLDAAGGSVARRLAPVLGGLGVVAVVFVVLRRLVRR